MRKGIIESVNIAIESIRQRDDLLPSVKDAVIRTLDNISQRDYYVHWTKDSIIEALRDYKRRTGRAPTVTNLTETGMPKSLTIQTHCGMKASLFLKQLFPENRPTKQDVSMRYNPYGFETVDDWLECFALQFMKHIDGICAKKYNIARDEGTPTWETIARHCQCANWKELMDKAGVEYKKKVKNATQIYVSDAGSPLIDKFEKLTKERQRLNQELFEIFGTSKK